MANNGEPQTELIAPNLPNHTGTGYVLAGPVPVAVTPATRERQVKEAVNLLAGPRSMIDHQFAHVYKFGSVRRSQGDAMCHVVRLSDSLMLTNSTVGECICEYVLVFSILLFKRWFRETFATYPQSFVSRRRTIFGKCMQHA